VLLAFPSARSAANRPARGRLVQRRMRRHSTSELVRECQQFHSRFSDSRAHRSKGSLLEVFYGFRTSSLFRNAIRGRASEVHRRAKASVSKAGLRVSIFRANACCGAGGRASVLSFRSTTASRSRWRELPSKLPIIRERGLRTGAQRASVVARIAKKGGGHLTEAAFS